MVRPFPYAWLPRWSRHEASLGRSVLRRVLPEGPGPGARAALPARFAALLGGALSTWPAAPRVIAREELRAKFEGDALCPVMRHATLGVVALIIDAPFALALAARALGADEQGALRAAAGRAYGPAQEGALALLCAQAAMLCCAPSPPPVMRGVTDRVSDALAAVGSDPVLAWPWRASVGLLAGEAVLVAPARAILSAPEFPARAVGADDSLDEALVTARVVAARASLAAGEVAALGAGDVLLLDDAALRLTAAGALAGEMKLALGGLELPVTADGTRWAVSGPAREVRRDPVGGGEQGGGGEGSGNGVEAVRTELIAALATEVDVVVAQGTFSVREVSAWRVGEVIELPARVGDAVLVRAGGVPVARGELCDVDGSVGVRITERL